MMEKIIAALGRYAAGGNPPVADWKLLAIGTSGEERYFVRDGLEQARTIEDEEYRLTVYVDSGDEGQRMRGEASVTVKPTDSAAEIDAIVRRAAFAASRSSNPWFGLPGAAKAAAALPASGFDTGTPAANLVAARAALYSAGAAGALPAAGPGNGTSAPGLAGGDPADSGADSGALPPGAARINSLELFLRHERRRFVNSRGQDASWTRWDGYTEFVVEARGGGGEVELTDDLAFSDPDPARLNRAVATRLAQVRDRAEARPLPALVGLPVLLTGREAEEVFGWFFDNARTEAVHGHVSTFTRGMNVQAPEGGAVADPLDIWAEPVLPGMPASAPFDGDGFPLERVAVIERGILVALTGSVRHADWLGMPRRGAFPLFSVSPGSASMAELRAWPHLEPVVFSDFMVNTATGDFGAEIRLAYWFDGKTRTPVTGGSISGVVGDVRATMRRSAERDLAGRSLCPVGLLLEGVSITGAT